MSNEIIVSVISAMVLLVGIGVDIYLAKRNTKELLKNSARQNQFNLLSDDIIILKKKLNEFYYPLRNYLEKSKSIYDVFKKNKPENFRTLTYLLNKEQLYGENNYELTVNDKAFLKQIFEVGVEIEKILAEKSSLIDDVELIEPYSPSEEYIGDDAEFPYPENKSLLSIAQVHLSFIRLAFDGEIEGNISNLSPYVFPRELNSIIDKKIIELERNISDLKSQKNVLIVKMKMNTND